MCKVSGQRKVRREQDTSAAPKGSSITEYKPPFKNSEEAPNTVSEPNQVANKADELRSNGRLLPANI
jgi:hypothetical protein